jgi:hypothetical protein
MGMKLFFCEAELRFCFFFWKKKKNIISAIRTLFTGQMVVGVTLAVRNSVPEACMKPFRLWLSLVQLFSKAKRI